jgi:hypothetical protein
MLEKVSEYLGELEGALDDYITAKKEFDFDTFGITVATKQVGISA